MKKSKYHSNHSLAIKKIEKYRLKAKLGLFELFDDDENISNEQLQNAGFQSYAEYEKLRLDVLNMIDSDIIIPEEVVLKLTNISKQRGATW